MVFVANSIEHKMHTIMVVTVRHGSKIKLRDLCGYIYKILPDYTIINDMKNLVWMGYWIIKIWVLCNIFDHKTLPHYGKWKTTLEFQSYHEQLPWHFSAIDFFLRFSIGGRILKKRFFSNFCSINWTKHIFILTIY